VICDVLGVPEDERGDFRAWSDVLVAPGQHDREAMAAALGQGFADMRRLVALKREHPGDDLLSALIQARDDDDRLDEEELVQLGTQLLFGGHETAVNLIGTSVVLLMRHPDQLAALRADPSLLVPAIEEIMRYESPTEATLLRVATTDVEVGDVTVRKGEAVMAMICSANFDERQLGGGFGHGIHHCIGAPLARIEGQVALRGLLDRFPGLRLAVPQEEIAWRPEGSTRGPIAVPIAW
jgi:cytochrome P450